jgi:hypothetical protein
MAAVLASINDPLTPRRTESREQLVGIDIARIVDIEGFLY